MPYFRPRASSILLLCLVLVVGAIFYIKQTEPTPTPIEENPTPHAHKDTLLFSGKTFDIEIAATPQAQIKGLSGRPSLPEGQGLLFWFAEDGLYPFWMPDMLFSIDIVWIDKDWNVVHIEENVAPETYPITFSSPTPARYVLELPAGTTQKIGANIGQKITLSQR